MKRFRNIRAKSFKNTKIVVCTLIMCALLTPALGNNAPDKSQTDNCLQVYLPREITVDNSRLTLGQISAIRGPESLVSKANEIELGQVSIPGQKIVFDRPTILSRLACNGISVSKVKIVGAEKITIKQKSKVIEGSGFIDAASDFITKHPPNFFVCRFEPQRVPADLILPGEGNDVELSPKMTGSSQNYAKVSIDVLEKGKQIGTREVVFNLGYEARKAVATQDIMPGTVISPDNVRIEKTESDSPEPADWKSPYGLLAKRKLPANTVIQPNMAGPAEPAVVVEKNRNVVIKIDQPGFLITAVGLAMEKGYIGDHIKVRNVDSQRIILVKVNEDGSVEPVL